MTRARQVVALTTTVAFFGAVAVGVSPASGNPATTMPTGYGSDAYGAFGGSGGPTPVPVTDQAGSTHVALGCDHALYLHPDGTVWARGYNMWGQLGSGNSTNSSTAIQVAGLTDVTQVAASCYSSMALKSDGSVWVWGHPGGVTDTSNPPDGTCPGYGSGSPVPCYLHPTQWVGPEHVTKIIDTQLAGALQADGTAWLLGRQISLPSPITDIATEGYSSVSPGFVVSGGRVYDVTGSTPTQVPGVPGNVVSIGAGDFTGYALTDDGSVWAWGDDRYGQLGDKGTTAQPTAIQVPGLPPATAIAGGAFHAVALDAAGGVWAWGDNVDGEVGPQQPRAIDAAPSRVPDLGPVTEIAAGEYNTLVLVNVAPTRTLTSIDLTPATSSAFVGDTVTFTATGTFSDGSTQDLTDVATWSSTEHSIATIGEGGTAIATSAGTTTISASNEGVSGSATLTIEKIPTRLTAAPALLQTSPLTLKKFDLRATLVAAHPATKALAGSTVRFTAKGKLLCVATTTIGGVADCNVGVSQPALNVILQNGYIATFAGTEQYGAASVTGKLIQ